MEKTLNRAWIQIDLDALESNIYHIKQRLSSKTKIMAVVKANAYGHGLVLISKKLYRLGIRDFAVASLEEGIILRKNGIKGNILILGFTNFDNLNDVIKYDLIQTIIDYEYAKRIKKLNLTSKLKCHIKINTGMHRIGEKFNDFSKLFEMYQNEKLDILGTFSHLCVSGSKNEDDINFTLKQIRRFNYCLKVLKINGFNVGKVHLQNSYGFLNYKCFDYDYVRMGILMYGIESSKSSYQKNKLKLKPVLSLKARITRIGKLNKNETIGYGRTKVLKDTVVASVSCGYADGYPRNLSNKEVFVKVGKSYAKIIGLICMDQLMIDITHIKNVNVGDVVTLIGDDDKISVLNLAFKAGTITNEILSRLGARLESVYVSKEKIYERKKKKIKEKC